MPLDDPPNLTGGLRGCIQWRIEPSPVARAAYNNAVWCYAVCRAHGVPSAFSERLWASSTRTPDRYPDAVTLTADATEADVLGAIDGSTGSSVKDSFALLDLRGHGFAVLFDAEWIQCASAPAPADGRIIWSAGPHDGMAPDEVVALTGRAGDAVVAHAVANLAAGVVGISNVASRDGWLDQTWCAIASAVQARFPRTPVVGYEQGAALACAFRHGFEAIGPVRIWVRSG